VSYRAHRAEPSRRRWSPFAALAVQLTAVLAVLGAAAVFLFGTHQVQIVDDGTARDFRTYAGTVSGALRQAGLRLGPHDEVTPGRSASIGRRVVIGRGRPVTLTVDGVTHRRWLTDRNVTELLGGLGLAHTDVRVTGPRGGAIPRTGATVTVDTRKTVTVVTAGAKTTYRTYAGTVAELLAQQHVALGGNDETEPDTKASLHGVATVTVFRVTLRRATETVTVPAPVQNKKRSDWMLDQQQVTQAGRDGKATQQVEYVYRDGKLYQRKVLSSTTVTTAQTKIVEKGTTPYPADDTGLNWAALAQCESTGNPGSVSSNGMYYGLYQFSVSTWDSLGGVGLPSEATPREQTYRAILLYKRSGKGQWPVCGSHL
jgi:uncharacterized protein YabE (DUF348 family)